MSRQAPLKGASMKRIKNIYESIYSFDNLFEAYLSARKGKRFRQDVLRFTANLEENLIALQNELMWGTYNVGRYREFYVSEPKKRLIMALQFRDRVVQWAIYRQLNPLLDKGFIYDSFGCRVGKGTHRAADRLQHWLRQADRKEGPHYYLKLDIAKYFYRVDHDKLVEILERKIADKGLIHLLERIIRSETVAFGLPEGMSVEECAQDERLTMVGMPIGNLTSQMFANLYLNELDQYAKHELKVRRYIRYMDDVIILHQDKRHLACIREQIREFLDCRLRLKLNDKTAIRPISMGVEFVGLQMWATHRRMKKKSAIKMRRRLKYLKKAYARGEVSASDVRASVQSYLGLLRHCNSYSLRVKVVGGLRLTRSQNT